MTQQQGHQHPDSGRIYHDNNPVVRIPYLQVKPGSET